MTNLALSPTGKRVVGRGARRDLHDSGREGRRAQPDATRAASAERDPAWSPDGKYVSYFSDKSGEYKLYIESQDGLDAAARDRARRSRGTTTRRRGRPTRRRSLSTDTNLNVWVLDVASGKAKVVGSDPWMVPERTLEPGVEPRLEVGRVRRRSCNSLYHAIFIANVETGETKQVTDGLADATWPAWDASGKYLWFLASTDFGLQVAVARHDVVRPQRELRAVPRGAEEGRAEAAAARERRGHRRDARARPRRSGRGAAASRGARTGDASAQRRRGRTRSATRSQPDRAPRRRSRRADRLRRLPAAHHRDPRRAGARSTRSSGRAPRAPSSTSSRGGR